MSQTPRGGNPKNTGQFSSAWGARKGRIDQYRLRAKKLSDEATDPRAKKKYRYYELGQQAKLKPLSNAQKQEMVRLEPNIYEKPEQVLLGMGLGASTLGLGSTYGSAMLMSARPAAAAGLATGTAALTLAALGSTMAASELVYRRRNEALGVSGWKSDGNLSDSERGAINGTIATMAILGAGGALFWADRKLGGQIPLLLGQKAGKVIGTHKIARNIRPAEVNMTAPWREIEHLSPHKVSFFKPLPDEMAEHARLTKWDESVESAEIALADAVKAAGGDHYRASHAFYGSPLVNPALRKLMLDVEEVLGLTNTTWAHAKINPTRAVAQAAAGIPDFRLEVKMQYDATQALLAKHGVRHVDLVRGLGLKSRDARAYGLPIITEMPKPGETPWVQLDALLPSLNSFATSPKMALDYALGRVVPVRGDVVVMTRTRLPRERIYSFSGFGTGHDAEVVVTGGDTPMQMMAVSRRLLEREAKRNGLTEEQVIGRLWDISIVSKRQRKYRRNMTLVSKKSTDLSHQKRVQAGLSLGGATLGLAALGTKGGAVATRQAIKRTPQLAGRLKLTPKAAETADKTSIGLVTTASGVGGASGIHFARLQQAEAKKEERVSKDAFGISKNVVDMESRRRDADRMRAKAVGQQAHRAGLKAGRFLRVDQDPDYHPSTPQRSLKPARPALLGVTRHPKDFGGINPEARRQRRMQGEQAGLAGVAGAAGTIAVGDQARRVAGRRLKPKLEARAARKEGNATRALRRMGTYRGQATMAGNRQKKYLAQGDDPKLIRATQQMARHTKRANTARAVAERSTKQAGHARLGLKVLGSPSGKRVAVLGGLAAASAAGSAAIGRSRKKGQGRKYSDWWD